MRVVGRAFEEKKERTRTMMALCCSNFATFDSSMDFDQEAETVPAKRPSTEIGPWYRGTNAPLEELKEATWRQMDTFDRPSIDPFQKSR